LENLLKIIYIKTLSVFPQTNIPSPQKHLQAAVCVGILIFKPEYNLASGKSKKENKMG